MHRKQAWSKRVRKERFRKKYLSRMQATRLLQVDSMHFRRLCILKGIYPRALERSKQKQSGNEKQYYLAREIKWLVRDQLADRMAQFHAWEKKVRRARAMGRTEDLALLHSREVKPQHSLVATIKERYPYFTDAVKDIDDALSLISLYAFLSPEVHSDSTVETHHALTSGLHERAKAIMSQWTSFVSRAHKLSRGFISIKGYYYEAIVRGERVRWLVPHEYAHKFPPGIQQYVMLSFLEFYVELMRFVLFKLEKEWQRDADAEAQLEDDGVDTNAENFVPEEQKSRTAAVGTELRIVGKLFDGLVFFISREVPAKHARMVIEACGGTVATTYAAERVTHMVVDRPTLPPGWTREAAIEYVQPQYLFDCLNARAVLPVHGYRMGEELPPHVSPFTVAISNLPEDVAAVEEVKKHHPKVVSYVPERVHEIRKFIDPTYVPTDPEGKAARLEMEDSDEDAHVAVPEMDGGDDDVALSDDELREARRRPQWEEEQVTEQVARSTLSALKVRKQREMNVMNAPTSEVVARRRQSLMKAKEARRLNERAEDRTGRKLAEAKRQEAITRRMQLQVARKKAAKYYKMVNSAVRGTERKAEMLKAKADQIQDKKVAVREDGAGLVNTRLEARRQRAEVKGKTIKKKKPDNPYKKLPKWVR